MPVTRSQTNKRLKASSSRKRAGSQQPEAPASGRSTPVLSPDEQKETHDLLRMLAPVPDEDLPDDFRRLRIDILTIIERFILHDRSLFVALQARAPESHVQIDGLRRKMSQTFSGYEDLNEAGASAAAAASVEQFERNILGLVASFESVREANPVDFTLAQLIVCALVNTLDKLVDTSSTTIAQFEMSERLMRKLGSEINESANDAVMPHVQDIEEIIEKLDENEDESASGELTKRLLVQKVATVKNAMGD